LVFLQSKELMDVFNLNFTLLLFAFAHRGSTYTVCFKQSALVIRTTFVPLCFSEKNVLITSGSYECSYNERNYLVFWKSVYLDLYWDRV
jgi:hypothetical protein